MNYVRKDQSIKCECECDYSLKSAPRDSHKIDTRGQIVRYKKNCGIDEQRNFIGKHKETIKRPFWRFSPTFPSTLYEQIQFHIVAVLEYILTTRNRRLSEILLWLLQSWLVMYTVL